MLERMPEKVEGTLLAGRFRLDRRLGEGGMGIVWAATNTTTLRRVAIKLLKNERADDPHVKRRFLREGRAASAVHHPNVVEIFDVLELEDGTPAMVMELLEGESLGQRVRRKRVLPLAEVAEVLMPAVAAIGTAHAAGVVHRDLKPDNIFLSNGHENAVVVKVLDFGIAKITGEKEPGHTDGLTGTGAMLGTPYYMAPEQLFTDETIDYRCDIWALGCILYECLAGVRPTQGENFADIIKLIARNAIVPLSEVAPQVPVEVSDLVTRMLSPDKEKRPQSLSEVRDVLRHYTDALASTFGAPILKPVKQSLDSSNDVGGGLRRADVEMFLSGDTGGPADRDSDPNATSDATDPRRIAATTMDAPSASSLSRDARRVLETQAGPDTQHGLGISSGRQPPKPRGRGMTGYVLAAIATAALVGVTARQVWNAPGKEKTAAAAVPAPPPAPAPAPTTPSATAALAAPAEKAAPAETVAPAAPAPTTAASDAPKKTTAKGSPGSPAVAAPKSTTTAAAPVATSNRGAHSPGPSEVPVSTATGGLVEKPPF